MGLLAWWHGLYGGRAGPHSGSENLAIFGSCGLEQCCLGLVFFLHCFTEFVSKPCWIQATFKNVLGKGHGYNSHKQ